MYLELMLPIHHLGKGCHFGELALKYDPNHPLKKTSRQATILCLEKTKFITIERNDYVQIIQKVEQIKIKQMV